MSLLPLDFYFDYISPFTYLALQRVPQLADRFGRELRFHPVDLKKLKFLAGNTAPPTRDIPIKLRYARIDQQRWAKRYGVPIKTPSLYDSSRLNRGYFFAEDRGLARRYLQISFARIWGEGGNMLDESLLSDVATELGWDADAFLRYTISEDGERRCEQSSMSAHQRMIFGVPTIMIGDEMWWGNDRLDFLEEHLESAV